MATAPVLDLPPHLDAERRARLVGLAARLDADLGPGLLGLVLSGSVGRGLTTPWSDLDVVVVMADAAAHDRQVVRSVELDEIPVSLADLESPPPPGAPGAWFRWSYAWAPVLLDRTGCRIRAAVVRQATLTAAEVRTLLIDRERLDGWLNLAYRSLKSARAGRAAESRLDAAESVPLFLDVLFALHGRVRPYNSGLPWELRTHPLEGWSGEPVLALVDRMLAGDPAALLDAFARVEELCLAHDRPAGTTELGDVIGGWQEELPLLRSRTG